MARKKPVQGELFSGQEHDIRLPRLDPFAGHAGLTEAQKTAATQRYGVSVKDAEKHYGRLIDQAFHDADNRKAQSSAVTLSGEVAPTPKKARPSAKATRERVAAGIKPEGHDWYERELIKHHNIAHEFGIPRSRISAGRSAIAQNISEPMELPSVRHVATQLQQGVSPDRVLGFGYHRNAQQAARIFEGTETHRDLPGHKPPGFEQSFEHSAAWVRPAMDRHMLRAGAPHLSDEQIGDIQRSGRSTKSQGYVAPVHRILEEGLRRAAEKRGMTGQQAQPIAWFPALRESNQRAENRRKAKAATNLSKPQTNVGSYAPQEGDF